MPTKFFFAENASRVIAGVQFEIFDISAGTAIGVYKTDDEKLQAELTAAKGVFVLTEPEYLDCLKKKHPKYDNWSVSKPESALAPVSIKGPGNVVVVESPTPIQEEAVEIKTVVEDIDALKVEALTAAEPTPVVVPTDPIVEPAPVAPPTEPAAEPTPGKRNRSR